MSKNELVSYLKSLLTIPSDDMELIQSYNAEHGPGHQLQTHVKPCFFSGALEPRKIVVINLNPKYRPPESGPKENTVTEQQRGLELYQQDILAFYENRFNAYIQMAEDLPGTFIEMSKHICSVEYGALDTPKKRKKFLQRCVLNLDWCYYYSSKYGGDFPDGLQKKFDHTLNAILKEVSPQFIYVMGKEFRETGWISRHTNVDLLAPLRNDIPVAGRKYGLFFGHYLDPDKKPTTPIFYLPYGAAQVKDPVAAQRISATLRANTPGLENWLVEKINQINDEEYNKLMEILKKVKSK